MEILKFEFKNDTEFWVKLYTISLKNKPPPRVYVWLPGEEVMWQVW